MALPTGRGWFSLVLSCFRFSESSVFRHPRNPRALRSSAKVGACRCDRHASHFRPANLEI
mgnify:CR=1 FL=1